MILQLRREHLNVIVAHAHETAPAECCGLIGGSEETALTVYQLHNIAPNPTVTYEAAPEDLFAAQRQMRDRGEELLGIYHSHPRATEPAPSETDVRLAYYPRAVYFIVGLGAAVPVMRAFRMTERDEGWEQVEYGIMDE